MNSIRSKLYDIIFGTENIILTIQDYMLALLSNSASREHEMLSEKACQVSEVEELRVNERMLDLEVYSFK